MRVPRVSILAAAVTLGLASGGRARADFSVTLSHDSNVTFGNSTTVSETIGGNSVTFYGSQPDTSGSNTLQFNATYQDFTGHISAGTTSTVSFTALSLTSVSQAVVSSANYTNNPTYFSYYLTIQGGSSSATYGLYGPIGGQVDVHSDGSVTNNLFLVSVDPNNPPPFSVTPENIAFVSGDASAFQVSNLDFGGGTLSVDITTPKAVPEPTSALLLGLGALGGLGLRRLRSRRA